MSATELHSLTYLGDIPKNQVVQIIKIDHQVDHQREHQIEHQIDQMIEHQNEQMIEQVIDQNTWCRLCEMGLTLNTPIRIIKNQPGCPMIVQCRNSRIMISRELSNQILVKTLEGQ